jgi:hypothetical protein
MDLTQQFESMSSEFREFRATLGRLTAIETDPAVRDQLEALAQELDGNFAQLQEVFPQAVESLNSQIAGVKESLAESKATAEALKDMPPPAPPAPPPAPPEEVPVDPGIGAALRADLLKRFGPLPKAGGQADEREIWEPET